MIDEYTKLVNGDLLPAFRVRTTDGIEKNLAPGTGVMYLVHFFILSCPYCLKSLQRLELIASQLAGVPGIEILSVGRDHTHEELRVFQQENHPEIPMAADPEAQAYQLFAEKKIPRYYLFDRKGVLIYQLRGYDEEEYLTVLKIMQSAAGDPEAPASTSFS